MCNHVLTRSDCYIYHPRSRRWTHRTNLPSEYGAAFFPSSAAGHRANAYIVGGRRYYEQLGE